MAYRQRASRLDTYLAGTSRRTRKLPIIPSKEAPKDPQIFSTFGKKKKAPKVFRFSFSVRARVLKSAFAGLADPTLNPSEMGLMEVCPDGFEMTVYQCRAVETGEDDTVYGFLSLNAPGLIDFVCERGISRMVKLVTIPQFLERDARDDDIVRVFSVDGSNLLSFKFRKTFLGFPRNYTLDVPFADVRTIPQFPIFSYGFEMSIPTNELESVLNNVLSQTPSRRPEFVSMNIDVNVSIRMEDKFELKVDESRDVWVVFPYWDSLKKISKLVEPCTLWIVTIPEKYVVLRFDLKEMGVFMYLKHAPEFFTAKDFPTIGTCWPLFGR